MASVVGSLIDDVDIRQPEPAGEGAVQQRSLNLCDTGQARVTPALLQVEGHVKTLLIKKFSTRLVGWGVDSGKLVK